MLRNLLLGITVAAVSAAVLLAQGMPYGTVKSWTGTMTIEGKETKTGETLTFSATGNFTISDDLMPAGARSSWPMPNPAATGGDPQKMAAAFQRWAAHVVVHHQVQGKDELGQPIQFSCNGDETHQAKVSFIATPGAPNSILEIESPKMERAACTGSEKGTHQYALPQTSYSLQIPFVSPAATLSGTKDFPGPMAVKITYKLTPTS